MSGHAALGAKLSTHEPCGDVGTFQIQTVTMGSIKEGAKIADISTEPRMRAEKKEVY